MITPIQSDKYHGLLEGNKKWSEEKLSSDPNFFKNLSKEQTPEFLWIGCSDSRVPASEVTGTSAGDLFVHRNIANLVVHTDLNLLSVLQYAVEVLKVNHIIVCGHYGCGGVQAAMSNKNPGLVGNWLRHIKDVYDKYSDELEEIVDEKQRLNRLVEVNVLEQVKDLAKTDIVQRAWETRELEIHGWVYGLETGRIKELNIVASSVQDLKPIYRLEKGHQ